MIGAGTLNKRVVIQSATLSTRDAYGNRGEQLHDVATIWAAIEPLSGRELERARTISATANHKVRIRWISGITPLMRIALGNRTLAINAVINVGEKNEELLLFCTEEVSQ